MFAEEILQHFNIKQYFDLVVGSNLDGTRTAKTEIIQYIIDAYDHQTLDNFIMIGDRNTILLEPIIRGLTRLASLTDMVRSKN